MDTLVGGFADSKKSNIKVNKGIIIKKFEISMDVEIQNAEKECNEIVKKGYEVLNSHIAFDKLADEVMLIIIFEKIHDSQLRKTFKRIEKTANYLLSFYFI